MGLIYSFRQVCTLPINQITTLGAYLLSLCPQFYYLIPITCALFLKSLKQVSVRCDLHMYEEEEVYVT